MKTGVWIDLKKAVLVHLHNDKKEIKTLLSEIEPQERTPGQSKDFVRFGNQFSNLEKQKENRLKNQTKEYMKRVADELSHSDAFVIFGPAGMKHELEKLVLKDKKLNTKLKGVKTADSMTDNQTAAWVVDFFK
ncbi:MAG: hypothetical protein WAU36_03080 [Cyclobacteriaceae bacterium]